jgi:23S rRNA (uracil1939-C5)-methyltransferase
MARRARWQPEVNSESLVELAVQRIGARGDGMAKYQGEPVFVPFTVPGDRVRARLGARRHGGREGLVVDRLASGPGRAAPRCRHFGICGGCALQHLDDASYRRVKLETFDTALERVGIDPRVVGPMRLVPPERRRARLGLARPRDPRLPVRIGHRERCRHELIDLRECPVLEPALFALIGRLRQVARDLISPGGSAEATLTRTDSGIDLLIEAVERPDLGACEVLARFGEQCDLARIVWRSGPDEIVVVERRPVRVLLSGVAAPFPPGAFRQASPSAEMILVEEVLSAVGPGRPVLDLFAGLGTFAFALARGGPVHAIEGDARTAAALARAAADQPRVTVERRDLARNPVPAGALARYAAAVFDPPRAGAARQAAALATSAIETIIAVSCNPATFARDAAKLIGGGYRLERVTPVDQFAWTPHLELAAVFRR